MKSYKEFLDWIFSFEKHPLNGQSNQEFKPNDNISAKVDDSALDKLVHTANELS